MIGSHHQVDADNPQYTVLIETCNDMLCFTVIEHYMEKMRCNLQMLTKAFLEPQKPTADKVEEKKEEKKEETTKPVVNEGEKVEKKEEPEDEELRLI